MPCSQSLAMAPKEAVEWGLLYFIDPSCVLTEWSGDRALSHELDEFISPDALFQNALECREKCG